MKLTQKDRSLILLIIAVLVILWGVYSAFSYLFFSAAYRVSDVNKIITKEKQQWFNVSRPLEASDLKDRIILLDFWTYACVNCIQSIPEIKKLEKEFGDKLTVIGVHSGKFDNEKDAESIRKAIIKHDITHPVINDSDLKIWNNFKVQAWPTFILLNPHGNVVKIVSGEEGLPKIKRSIKKLVSNFKYELNRDSLPIILEKHNIIGNVLNFPTKLEYAGSFSYKSRQIPVIFIANTGNDNIIASSLTGEMVLKIGSGKEGFEDGSFNIASFNEPQGLLFDNGKLYIADTGNHALRVVDFKDGVVRTLVGSGQRGEVIEDNGQYLEAKNVDLASPTDIEFFLNKDVIAIANSGTNQILAYNTKKNTIMVLAGDGNEGIDDGKYRENSLAQTADMSVFNHKLYFVDAETSSLRVLDEAGNVKTLIGKGLFDFGHKNGDKD